MNFLILVDGEIVDICNCPAILSVSAARNYLAEKLVGARRCQAIMDVPMDRIKVICELPLLLA